MYQVLIEKNALKQLEKIPKPFYPKIKAAILALAKNPRPEGSKKLQGRNAYRIRIASYRVVYGINDKTLIVQVLAAGHRKNIYK